MPPGPDTIVFEPVVASHHAMLGAWLDEPHVRQWWGDSEEELALIQSIAEGDDGTEGFVVRVDGEPVGYVQSWRPARFKGTRWADEAPWMGDEPADTVGVDIFIGPADRIERGIGTRIIRAFALTLFEKGTPRLIIDPDAANTRAVRAYEKAGFRPYSEWIDEDGTRTLLMELKAAEGAGA